MVRKIKFTIDKNGEIDMAVEGAQGNECLEITKPFEAILGPVNAREMKDSFYSQNIETEETSLGK